ncbi:enhancer of mRNA-decapping protein 4-like [Henckelia pumila]|uniref:enhancer of mRNA-decapping protein 4-like n=1 Tax=Henckelia pumila TaxID=405737 RepID=UPI003C6EA3E0
MATAGNPNPPGGAPPFDMPLLFRPSTSPAAAPASQNISNSGSSFTNPNFISAPFPPPSASFPPPAAAGGGQYSYLPQTSPFHLQPQFHHLPMYSPPSNPREFANVHPQRSVSYPTPLLQPQVPVPSSPHHLNLQAALVSQNPNTHGARLMALLSAPPSTQDSPNESTMPMPQTLPTSSGSDFSMPQYVNNLSSGPGLLVSHQGPVMRMPSSKPPKGRHLSGDHLVYDIDIRLPGEVQPQLEVTPITKYVSDPGLVVGRQIAVNKTYICYGLKLGAIRVLNINTALRSLLKGLAQRVTDMAFFTEDVHLLAGASVDGRVYVWKIAEGPDEEDKQQITGRIVTAVQITGEGESVHPRVCWHCHKQEVLALGIGKNILKIDTTKVGKGENFSADEPLKCTVDKLIDGIQLVGSHDGEVTDLSMCQWMTTRLVSASVDGTIKIWEDRNLLPIAVLLPHGGQPVSSVTFLAAPHRPDHIILITGGPLNREVKIWVSASEEGWLLPIDAESWHCTQTLELTSSEARIEEAFFNQVIALSQAGLLLLANAKRNAIYVVHLEYGPNPAATRMNYIAEFTVTMRILSFTGTSESLPNGEQVVQVYCVQTQAIQQYALDLSQCLPPAVGNLVYEKSESNVSREASITEGLANLESSGNKTTGTSLASSAPSSSIHAHGLENVPTVRCPVDPVSAESPSLQEFIPSSMESKQMASPVIASDGNLSPVASPSLPLSPRLSGTLSGFRNPSSSFEHGVLSNDRGVEPKIVEYTVDRQMDTIHSNLSDVASLDGESRNYEYKHSQDDMSLALSHSIEFRHPTHLVTPSEILMANSSSEVMHTTDIQGDVELKIQDVGLSSETRNSVVEVKVVDETKFNQNIVDGSGEELQTFLSEDKENTFCSEASDLGIEMARECRAVSPETYIVEEDRQFDGTGGTETVAQPSTVEEEIQDSAKDGPSRVIDPSIPVLAPQPAPNVKGKKQKGKSAQGSGISLASPSAFNSADSSNEPGISYSTPVESQIYSMQEVLHQLLALQKDMQKQMATMIAVPVIKEGKRLEASLGRNMEKAVKANADALWARLQEENAKQEKASRERAQQVTDMISGFLNKDLPSLIEKTVKREVSSLGQSVARAIIPTIEKAISTSIVESFQKGVGDKAVNQLEKSVNFKLEAIVARQLHSQFQSSGKQALQEMLKSSLEVSVIPAFEMSCRAMFEQVDSAFQKGMVEHTAAAQQQFEASHSSLALVLRDAITSASSMSKTLSNELLDGQRKLVAFAAGVNSKAANPLTNQLSNGLLGALHEKLEVDPTKELSRLVAELKYEDAFIAALHRSDVTVVSWLCSHVDLPTLLAMNPLPLSQGVLLSLLQQLACDISKETPRKLTWMREVLTAINPADPVINVHVRPIFEQVYQIMNHHHNMPTTTGSELSNVRLIMHVINSMLMGSK